MAVLEFEAEKIEIKSWTGSTFKIEVELSPEGKGEGQAEGILHQLAEYYGDEWIIEKCELKIQRSEGE